MDGLAQLCAAVDPDRVTEQSVRRIRSELPAYRAIPMREHLDAVARQQRNQIRFLAAGREVGGDALDDAADLARRRARQGIDIEVLLGAYHLGDQVFWQSLVDAADQHTTGVLPRAAGLLFGSLHRLSTALTTAHAETTLVLQTRRITAAQRLVELLSAEEDYGEAATHARSLGLDPDAEFVAAVWSEAVAAVPGPVLQGLDAAVAAFAVHADPRAAVLLCQGMELDAVAGLLEEHSAGRVGLGLARAGLDGASRSLRDARLAAAAGVVPGGVVRFDQVWVDACVLDHRDLLADLLEPVAAIARAQPHLVDAVVAHAAADLQVARAAAALHLHPNSLSYRLERWSRLTGWNPRTFDGLRRSLLAIAVAADAPGQASSGGQEEVTPRRSADLSTLPTGSSGSSRA